MLRACIVLVVASLVACVTINIYFPAEEVRKAAEDIVKDVRGNNGGQSDETEKAKEPEARLQSRFASLLLPAEAHAREATSVSNAAIRRLKQNLRQRNDKLEPYFERGIIGEGREGYVRLLQPEALSLRERAKVRRLVDAENQDRRLLYQEVAKALDIDRSQIDKVEKIFAEQWSETAKSGWPVQRADGSWKNR
jgi:uncharacterized protein YdbL (DUF1318 family)